MLFCKGCCKPPFDCYSAVKGLLERLPRLTQRLPRLTSLAAFTNDEGKTSWPIQLLMLTSALPAAFALTLAPRAFSSSATRTLRSRTRTPALPAALARRLAPPAPSPRSSRTSFKGTSGRRVAAPGAQAGYLERCPAIICATGSLRAWRRWGGPTARLFFGWPATGWLGFIGQIVFPLEAVGACRQPLFGALNPPPLFYALGWNVRPRCRRVEGTKSVICPTCGGRDGGGAAGGGGRRRPRGASRTASRDGTAGRAIV